jgi:hypothetical protein
MFFKVLLAAGRQFVALLSEAPLNSFIPEYFLLIYGDILRLYILHREALRKTRQPLTRGAQSPPSSHPPAPSGPTFSFLFDNNGA